MLSLCEATGRLKFSSEQVGFLLRLQEMSSSSGLVGSVDSTVVVARDVDLFLTLIRQGRNFI